MPTPLEPAKVPRTLDMHKAPRARDMSRLPLSELTACESVPSVVDELSLAARLAGRRRGDLPARVGNAEAAVARNHLLHAHLEGREGAILVHDPSADIGQRARGLS
jgi:hypothetical protein